MTMRFAGIDGIRREFEQLGDREALECAQYVLDAAAGSSSTIYDNSDFPMDCDEFGLLEDRKTADGSGKTLLDFYLHSSSRLAVLEPMHVAALRIYTTAAFMRINEPLRDLERRARGEPHPLPLTTALIRDALGKLRVVGARDALTANAEVDLWRGLKNVAIVDAFMREGGTELAPMSATSELAVAVQYSVSDHPLLIRIRTRSSMERGADISWLSTFPHEKEWLFPPLTYLQPVGEEDVVELGGVGFRVLVVEPRL